ncbi:TPA: type II toxin-antitoxin system RelE/ParE family toxin, partial [Enterococcus faecium]|nr:type II toxin-antitoxin system RelE/ParE family toxin [Enterococcus faecium]HAQ7504714.1 type II toxin-antitoxin system RelE/ParE family toxin [Enterococcus faecium]HAQ7931223.1 type II toxin-antitoxin system RelE/ParE family toxin [Enterococcus faecium]
VAQRLKWVKKLDTNLYELRSKVGSNIQRAIYFHVVNGRYVITHGFTKKTEKTPISELKHAKELREEWFTNDD